MTKWWSMMAAVCLSACASIPAPSVLDDIDRVRESPSAKLAKRDAPTAFASAEKLRAEARRAFEAEDAAAAQILGERALAAYEEAVALGRVVRADQAREQVAAAVKKKQARLAELDDEHQKVAADIAAIEKRLAVLKNLEPTSPAGPAGPAREKARWQAVESLHLGARLLCSATDLLVAAREAKGGKYTAPPAVKKGHEALDALKSTLDDKPKAAPIDAAMRARATCLKALTHVRRDGADPKKATGASDALLEELSKLGKGKPSRDDRGVVVTLRGLFDGDALNSAGKEAINAIASTGKKHGRFPVMVVVHDEAKAPAASRGAAVVDVLRSVLQAGRVRSVILAGDASPVVDPNGPSAKRNVRIEVVFVSPELL